MEYLIVKTIGIDFTIKCLGILSTSVKSIYNLASNLKATENMEIKKIIKELDIDNDVILIDSLLQEINIEKIHSKTIGLSLNNIKETILEIEKTFDEINKRETYNNSLWYGKGMRSYKFDDLIESLKILKVSLNNRKRNLFELIKIKNYIEL